MRRHLPSITVRLVTATAALAILGLTRSAHAQPMARPRAGDALLLHVLVPLCDNAQVNCASRRAGDPVDLDHNLYWGAIFGHRTFAIRKASPFTLVSREGASGDRLERVVVRRRVAEGPELLLVLDGFRGDRIDAVVDQFFDEAAQGRTITFRDGDRERREAVDVVGYAGHNRMMDGKAAPPAGRRARGAPIPSFVLACDSVSTFAAPLRARGSTPLVLTRTLMAPEGYVLEAVALGLAKGQDAAALRRAAGRAYARWQSLREAEGLSIFADLSPRPP